jgi:hypothetical protein
MRKERESERGCLDGMGEREREREREIMGERFTGRIPTCNKMNGQNKVRRRERERERKSLLVIKR